MNKTVLWSIVGVIVLAVAITLLLPSKDYKQLALGDWYDKQNSVHAHVTPDTITFRYGKRTEMIYYELHVDRSPMEIEVWRNPDRKNTYFGTIVFNSDDKVTAKALPGAGANEDNYFKQMASKLATVWDRVEEE